MYAAMLGACARKVPYDDRASAEAVRGDNDGQVTYRCPVCGRFHNGRPHRRARFRRDRRKGA